MPLGGYAVQRGDMLTLNGFVASVDGQTFLTARADALARCADALGRAVARAVGLRARTTSSPRWTCEPGPAAGWRRVVVTCPAGQAGALDVKLAAAGITPIASAGDRHRAGRRRHPACG